MDSPYAQDRNALQSRNKVASAIFALAVVLLIVMQIAYFIYNQKSGYEYIADWMLYAVNAAVLLCLFFAILFGSRRSSMAVPVSAVVLALLFCANLVLMLLFGFASTSIVSISPGMRHITVLKQHNETGEVTVFRNNLLLFARRYEPLADTVDGDIKMQWLADDICTVTYTDTNGALHQYVATYGDRGNGVFYYEVANVIRGKWALESHNTDDKKMVADDRGITITDGSQTWGYDYGDCVQFGTLALVLCREGIPEWTIALNEDCEVVSGLRILNDGGTISLCAVSAGKTAALSYFRTDNPLAQALAAQNAQEESGAPVATPLPTTPLSSDFSGLAQYNTIFGVMVLQTNSDDVFEVGRMALAQGHMQTGASVSDAALQITQMTLLAGDINEFLIGVKATGSNDLGTPLDYDWTFRIKRGDGVYGAVRVAGTADGTQGLTALSTPQVKDTADNPDFFVFAAAQMTGDTEQQGLAAAQQMADMLAADPALSGFASLQGLVRVQTDETDMFMVTRMAAEENRKMFADDSIDSDVQIARIILIAGDENEWLAKVYANAVLSGQDMATTTQQYVHTYRIKKGDGVYLAMASGYDTVNAAGLSLISPAAVKDD